MFKIIYLINDMYTRGGKYVKHIFFLSPFSSAELEARVSFADHNLFIVHRRCRCPCRMFHILIIFSRTTGPFSTKLGTKHPWVKRSQVCSNEGLYPFSRGDNYITNERKYWNLTLSFSRTTRPVSTKLGLKHPWVKGIQVSSNEGPCPLPRGDN